jgi:hypothetical protein
MSALSQDLYAASGVPLTVVKGGGGGGSNPVVSTISALGITNLSSINGQPYEPGTLPANAAFQSVSTQSLLVSSINSQPYTPGAVAANLVVSSLTAAFFVSTLGNLSVGGNLGVSAGSIMTYGSTFFTASGLNGTQLNLTAPNGAVALISPSTVVSAVGGAPSYVSMPGNLQVSTINGSLPLAAKGLGGYGFTAGAFSTNVGTIFPNDLSNRMCSMSTIPGHTYRLDVATLIQPTQPSVAPATVPADNAVIVYVASGNTFYTDSIPTGDIYNISRGPLSSFKAAYSIPFLASASTATAYIGYSNNNAAAPFSFTNTTLFSSINASVVTDLGTL